MVAILEQAQPPRRLAVLAVVELVDGLEVTVEGEEEFCRGQIEGPGRVCGSRMRTCQIGMFWFRGDGSDDLLQAFVVDVVGCPLGDLVAGEAEKDGGQCLYVRRGVWVSMGKWKEEGDDALTCDRTS